MTILRKKNRCFIILLQLASPGIILTESCKIFKNAARQLKIYPLSRSYCFLSFGASGYPRWVLGVNFTGQSKSDLRRKLKGRDNRYESEENFSYTDSSSFISIISIRNTRENCTYRFANMFSFTLLSQGTSVRAKINDVINFIRLDYWFIYCDPVSGCRSAYRD